jgi:DNA-binding XRE family transcriptional regulator
MIISPQQIKAARAWLDWTRETLAEKSGVSSATIRNLERGNMSIRSAEDVRAALEKVGFHFHGASGLSRRSTESRVYDGQHSREEFHEDLLTTVSKQDCEIDAIFESQAHLARALGVTDFERPERLERLGKLATVKCLLTDARQLPMSVPSLQFRASGQIRISPMASLVYGDKTAVIMTDGMSFTIHVTKDVGIAQNGLKLFASGWEAASPVVPQSVSNRSTRPS